MAWGTRHIFLMESLIPVPIFFVGREIPKIPTNNHVFQMKIIIINGLA